MKKFILSISVSLLSLFSIKVQSAIVQDIHFPNAYYNASSLPQGISGAYTFVGNETPQITVLIAWDLNGVIFEKRYSITGMLQQTAVTKKYGWKMTFTLLRDFGYLYKQKRIFKNANDPRGYVWSAMFDYLEEQTTPFNKSISNQNLAQLLREFSQEANHLDFELIQVLEKLERLGHKNAVLSNMGQGLVDLQVVQLKKQLSELPETQVKKREDLECALTFLTQPTNVLASKENGWLLKPDRSIYETFLSKNTIQTSNKVITILVDDKQENIDAALADGLLDIGIYYKDVRDLRRILYYIFPHFVQTATSRKSQQNTNEF